MKRPSLKVKAPTVDLTGLPTRYMNKGELEILIGLIGMVAPKVVIEVGCNSGRTAAALLRNIPEIEKYVGIDVPPGYTFAKECQKNEVPAKPGELALDDPRFELVLRNRGTFDLTTDDLEPCDAIFIDGDHGRAAVLNDYNLAKLLVRPGGIIVFHDDNCLPAVDVTQTLDELAAAGEVATHVEGTWLAYILVPHA